MSSLADLPDLVGFFSYSRSDDQHSDGALSLLRKRIRSELRLQLGRELRLWQDIEAIPLGTLWEGEIRKAIAESAFFIAMVSPSALNSKFCRMEFEAFLARERELGRDDVVFPILYIPVPGLANAGQRDGDEVLRIIHARQYADWTDIRLDDTASSEVRKEVARFCKGVVEALRKAWESPEERRRRAEIEAQRLKEQEEARRIAEAEARRLAEDERWRTAEAEAQRQAGAARHSGGTEDGTSMPAKPDAGAVTAWRPSPRALVGTVVLAVFLIGSVLGWLVMPWRSTNRLSEAEPLFRRALAIDEKSYGPDHPDVARDLNNLARLLQATNRLSEAEPLYLRALAIDEKSYGPDHPDVARDLNNLALLLQDTNRLSEAEPLVRRALAIDEKSYGPDHPTTKTIRENLQLLRDQLAGSVGASGDGTTSKQK